jgi:enoyl-CoA hydratase/carnithine racemase
MDTTPHLEVEEADAGIWTLRLARPERRNALAAEIARRPADSVQALRSKIIESTGLAGRITLAL